MIFMYYVYLLRSVHSPEKTYVGFTSDLEDRLSTHDSGGAIHTSRYCPWELVTYLVFKEESKAKEFETYLKSQSGRAFSQKRLW